MKVRQMIKIIKEYYSAVIELDLRRNEKLGAIEYENISRTNRSDYRFCRSMTDGQ